MDILQQIADLRRELGDDRFNALISGWHRAQVMAFAETLIALPLELTLGNCVYVLSTSDAERDLVRCFGEEDGKRLVEHGSRIPIAFRGRAIFSFPDWRNSFAQTDDEKNRFHHVAWENHPTYKRWMSGLNRFAAEKDFQVFYLYRREQ